MNAQQNWNQFLQVLLQDRSAQEGLKGSHDNQSFIKMAVDVAAKKGFKFTVEQLEAQIFKAIAPMFDELSDDQLELVVGGGGSNNGNNWQCIQVSHSLVFCKEHTLSFCFGTN
jgi:hypothetical protein